LSWTGRKVLVTGAGGFIGSHLCEALVERGAKVTAMLRYSGRADFRDLEHLPPASLDAIEVVSGDVQDPHFVLRAVAGKEVVFHLAALIAIPHSYAAPASYVRTNVEGTLNVLEAARQHGVARVVHTSTSECYGTALYSPIDEKHPLQGQSPYSASKIGADKIAESYHRSFGLPVATLRPFNTYGPRQSARAVIPTIVSQALSEPEVRLGSLTPVRDLTFVRDTVEAFLKIAETDAAIGRTVHVGTGRGVTIAELARLILSLMKVAKPVVEDAARVRPKDSEVHHLLCDNRLAGSVLSWRPTVSLEEGLARVIEFVTRHRESYKSKRYVQ
jgi:NAD dependent epimerase/dehydratase